MSAPLGPSGKRGLCSNTLALSTSGCGKHGLCSNTLPLITSVCRELKAGGGEEESSAALARFRSDPEAAFGAKVKAQAAYFKASYFANDRRAVAYSCNPCGSSLLQL